MDTRIDDIEHAALHAWPAAHVLELDGWRLRVHWNMTGRANSVWPNQATGGRSLPERLDLVERFYHGRLQPARYQISPAARPLELDAALDARGYHRHPGASVQISNLEPLLDRLRSALEDRPIDDGVDAEVLPRPTDEWYSVQRDALQMDSRSAHLRRTLIQRIPTSGGFAICRWSGEPAAIGIGVRAEGWLGIFGMATATRFRRRGAALHVMAALTGWALEEGTGSAYLQVFETNHPALALYARVGFEELYGYHYRFEPWSP